MDGLQIMPFVSIINDLYVMPFVSGVRFLTPIDTTNNVITDVATETDRAEFMFLGKEDSPENYKAIDRNTPLPEPIESDVQKTETI